MRAVVFLFLIFVSTARADLGVDILFSGYDGGHNIRSHAYYLFGDNIKWGATVSYDYLHADVNESFAGLALVWGKLWRVELDLGVAQRTGTNFFGSFTGSGYGVNLGVIYAFSPNLSASLFALTRSYNSGAFNNYGFTNIVPFLGVRIE